MPAKAPPLKALAHATVAAMLLTAPMLHARETPPPWLRKDLVPSLMMEAVDQVSGDSMLNATPAIYDVATQSWSVTFMPVNGTPFIGTLDETTGKVCAHRPNETGCLGTGSAKLSLDLAKASYAREEEGRRNPAPDIEDLWLTVIRYAQPPEHLPSGPRTVYLALRDTNDERVVPAASFLDSIHVDGVTFVPASKAPDIRHLTWLTIGQPLPRPDGDYDVTYGQVSGIGGQSSTLRTTHTTAGWRVVSRQQGEMM
ncbi:hypothetical protein FIV34_17725 [Luteibacter pinisoli]|uniref:Secreted protein n=1 Tax=Luteibacter pinisoli TaxID=2589080 RepID=A0A4Y5Z624_9GAMM|nr:hypothetical protein [Luteibacter pinisoli]QDE40920.1 hypothetical protein FIV34_17725 [Luteibacter pinisoli]